MRHILGLSNGHVGELLRHIDRVLCELVRVHNGGLHQGVGLTNSMRRDINGLPDGLPGNVNRLVHCVGRCLYGVLNRMLRDFHSLVYHNGCCVESGLQGLLGGVCSRRDSQ